MSGWNLPPGVTSGSQPGDLEMICISCEAHWITPGYFELGAEYARDEETGYVCPVCGLYDEEFAPVGGDDLEKIRALYALDALGTMVDTRILEDWGVMGLDENSLT